MDPKHKFTGELIVAWAAGVAHWIFVHFPHFSIAELNSFLGTVVNIGLAITTTYAVVSGTVKFVGMVKGWFSGKPTKGE